MSEIRPLLGDVVARVERVRSHLGTAEGYARDLESPVSKMLAERYADDVPFLFALLDESRRLAVRAAKAVHETHRSARGPWGLCTDDVCMDARSAIDRWDYEGWRP